MKKTMKYILTVIAVAPNLVFRTHKMLWSAIRVSPRRP